MLQKIEMIKVNKSLRDSGDLRYVCKLANVMTFMERVCAPIVFFDYPPSLMLCFFALEKLNFPSLIGIHMSSILLEDFPCLPVALNSPTSIIYIS